MRRDNHTNCGYKTCDRSTISKFISVAQCDGNLVDTFALDCSPQALADFENLITKYGTVDPEGLTQRIREASRLLFLRESNGEIVGVGAVKRPQLSYRRKVFAKAQATTAPDEYRVELG